MQEAVEAFLSRGLDIETATRMGAKFNGGKFLFDYQNNGVHQYYKIRPLKEKRFLIEPSGQKLQLWNLDSLRGLSASPGDVLVITEGEFDAIAVMQACGGFVTSVPNGVAGGRSEGDIIVAQDRRFAYLWAGDELIPEIAQFSRVVLCTDNDDPGLILRDELALRIGPSRCWHVVYPEGCKDANDVLLKEGVAGVRAMIADARPMRPGHLVRPAEVPPKPLTRAVTTGWDFFDDHLKIARPELMVVTGEPNHGKGQFVRCLTFHLAETHQWRIAYLTPEDPPHRLRRDMERFSKRGFDPKLFSGEYVWKCSQEQAAAADLFVDRHFLISVPPDDEPITIETVEAEMESAALIHNCQVFVLDPWNEIEHTIGRNETENMYIEKTLRRLLRKTRRLNLLLIIVAHPTKIGEGEKVSLYKISGSAQWRNKCQHGIVIRKPDKASTLVEVEVEKSKDWETMGEPGSVELEFYRAGCDYLPVS